MMNAAFRRESVNAVYLSLHAKSLKDLLACVRDIPIRGLSITMPYKQDIVDKLENSDPLTRQIGACWPIPWCAALTANCTGLTPMSAAS